MRNAILGLMAVGLALFFTFETAPARECVTFEKGVNGLARMARESGLRIAVMRLSAEQTATVTAKFPLKGKKPHRVAFVAVSGEPVIAVIRYDRMGCAIQGMVTVQPQVLDFILSNTLGKDVPQFNPVRYTRGA